MKYTRLFPTACLFALASCDRAEQDLTSSLAQALVKESIDHPEKSPADVVFISEKSFSELSGSAVVLRFEDESVRYEIHKNGFMRVTKF